MGVGGGEGGGEDDEKNMAAAIGLTANRHASRPVTTPASKRTTSTRRLETDTTGNLHRFDSEVATFEDTNRWFH
jgi:hypothetical protein